MMKQDLRYRGSRRWVAFVVMLAISVGLVPLASVCYNTARADALTAAEDVRVTIGDVQALELTAQEKDTYHVGFAARLKDFTGNLTGYAVVTTVRGYKSDISVQTTFAADGKTIATMEVLKQDETEYLGTRVETPEFTSLFTGRLAPIKLWGTATLGSPIDAISGSTVSSQAVVDAVNYAYAFLKTKI